MTIQLVNQTKKVNPSPHQPINQSTDQAKRKKKSKEDAFNKVKEEAAAKEVEKQAAVAAAAAAAAEAIATSARQFPKCQPPQRLDLVTADATRMEALCVKTQMLNRSKPNIQWWKRTDVFDEIKTQLTRSPSTILPSI